MVVQIWLSSVPGVASMKALPKRKGNGHTGGIITSRSGGTSMKVSARKRRNILSLLLNDAFFVASLKVYTSRYRTNGPAVIRGILICLIEIPYESVRKMRLFQQPRTVATLLNESPSNGKGNTLRSKQLIVNLLASMKVSARKRRNTVHCAPLAVGQHTSMKALPKRKGNPSPMRTLCSRSRRLNESPSEKEGKSSDPGV